MQTKKN